jgi:predicted dehydrogenase
MEISWVAQESEMVYEIFDSSGKRVQTFLPHGYIIERMQESPASVAGVVRSLLSDINRLCRKWAKFAVDQIKKPQSGHLGLISSFIESINQGSPPPVTGEHGRNTVKLLECIEESLNERKPVTYSAW